MKITVFDSGCLMKAGHHYSINKGIKIECEKRGIDFELLCFNKASPDVVKELNAKPHFSDWMYIHASDHPMSGYLENYIKINASYLQDLRKLPDDMFKRGDILLLHTMNYNILYGLSEWLRTKDPNNFPRIYIVCGLPGYYDYQTSTYNIYATLYNYSLKCLFETRVAGLVQLAAATRGMAEQFSVLSDGKDVRIIPIACPYANLGEDHGGERTPKERPADKKRLTVSFFGHATGVKGLQHIPPIAHKILDKFPNVEFQIHANPFDPFKQFAYESQQKYGDRVKFLPGELSSDVYFEKMCESDLIVLPYHPLYYKDSISGIFLEGLCLNKPLVVPEGSWMENEAKANGGGVESFRGWDPDNLEVAISRALQNYESLKSQAARTGAVFRNKYSFRSFVDHILAQGDEVIASGAGDKKFSIKFSAV